MKHSFSICWNTEIKNNHKLSVICKPGGYVLVEDSTLSVFHRNLYIVEGTYFLIGKLDGEKIFLNTVSPGTPEPDGYHWERPRILMAFMDSSETEAVSRAAIISSWEYDHRFCGRCASATVISREEPARICPSCGFSSYPRISPAVIVRITSLPGSDLPYPGILLAHNKKFPGGVYSCIAGFVEPGESAENAVKREVMEEAGLEISNIKYLKSQSWPMPHALMLGFSAESSGNPVPDGIEIAEAGWFPYNKLPHIPRKGSLARWLIDKWLEEIEV